MAAKSGGEKITRFGQLRAKLNPDHHINTSLNSAAERERAVELLGCMRVIQTLLEINQPSHLPWQLTRLGRCVLAVDKSEESLGLTGHTPRRVANNVSGKSEGSCHKYVHPWFYSRFCGTAAIFRIPSLFLFLSLHFYVHSSAFYSLQVSVSFSLPRFLFFSPAFSHAGR